MEILTDGLEQLVEVVLNVAMVFFPTGD